MLNPPPMQSNLVVNGKLVTWTQPWGNWMTRTWQIVSAAEQSGTTAQRPTTNLWVGRPYFDTSLGANGKPIWVDKTGAAWVLADGTAA